MRVRWFIAFVTWLLLYSVPTVAKNTIFIPAGEVEGIYVGSFYISSNVISNQDYFLFIQQDGYKKRYLWDTEALQYFEKYKTEQGEFAPRSWEGSSPPIGKEFEPVLDISLFEARAYAKNIGWIIPSPVMWKRALQVNEDIGPYPWQNGQESTNGIRVARYYAPAHLWEEKLKTFDKKLEKLKKSSAKLSSVNVNSSSIRQLQRQIKKFAKNVQGIKSEVTEFTKKMAPEKLQKRIASMENQLQQFSQKQEQLFTRELPEIKTQFALNIENKLRERDTTTSQLMQRIAALEKSMQNQANWEQKYQALAKKLEILESKWTVIPGLENKLTKLQGQFIQLEDKDQTLAKQLQSIQTLNSNLQKQQQNEFPRLYKKIVEVEQKLTQLSGGRILNAERTIEEMRSKISSLKEIDMLVNTELETLKKQCAVLSKEDRSLLEKCNNLGKQQEKLQKDITGLFRLCTQLRGAAKDLDVKLSQQKAIDREQSQKNVELEKDIKTLTDTAEQLVQQDEKILTETKALRDTDFTHEKQVRNLEAEFNDKISKRTKKDRDLQQSIQKLSEKFTKDFEELNTQVTAKRKDLQSTFQSQANKISNSVNKNRADIVALQNQLGTTDIRVKNSFASLGGRVQKLEETSYQLESNLRVGSRKLRINMIEIGEKIRQLFLAGGGALIDKDGGAILTEEQKRHLKKEKQKLEKQKQKLEDEKKKLEEVQQLARKREQQLKREYEQQQRQFREKKQKLEKQKQQLEQQQEIVQAEFAKKWEQAKAQLEEERKKLQPQKSKPESPVVVKKEAQIDKSALAEFCYLMSRVYYQHGYRQVCFAPNSKDAREALLYTYRQLILNSIEFALRFNDKYQEAKVFRRKHWRELNCPEEMVYVAKGTAIIGRKNRKQVKMHDFYIDRHEVTRSRFDKFVQADDGYSNLENWSKQGRKWIESVSKKAAYLRKKPLGWNPPKVTEANMPVVNINFYEAQAYAKWRGKRLPTPEEWEYAYRGSSGHKFPWGNTPPQIDNYFKTNYRQLGEVCDPYSTIAPVNAFPEDFSHCGAEGMAGNVAEWCNGFYKNVRYGAKVRIEKDKRVVKGGSFKHLWFRMQGFRQYGNKADKKFAYVGFRCAKDIPQIED